MTDESKPHRVTLAQYSDESNEQAMARLRLDPSFLAAQTIGDLRAAPADFHLQETVNELRKYGKEANENDLQQLESMLVSQAHTLDALFNTLLWKANRNLRANCIEAGERYMRLALKAQSQCRTSIESLAEIKNPKAVAFVQQANIAGGHQQVNNGTRRSGRRGRTGARKSKSSNELLEAGHGKRLERGAPGEAGIGDPSMATLGEVHGAEIPAGPGASGKEQP